MGLVVWSFGKTVDKYFQGLSKQTGSLLPDMCARWVKEDYDPPSVKKQHYTHALKQQRLAYPVTRFVIPTALSSHCFPAYLTSGLSLASH